MRVICAPDKFKHACTAAEAAAALAAGVREADPTASVVELPLADGGEGTLDVLRSAFPQQRTVRVQDALGRPVEARVALSADGRRALVESAQACGLWRIAEPDRNPLKTTTFGVGELIRAVLDTGAVEIAVGLGGSATSDGGVGMAAALGARFLDGAGKDISPTGGDLARLHKIDLGGIDVRVRKTRLTALCDVTTPMLGEGGASRKFVLQKGGTTQSLVRLEKSLAHLQAVATGAGIALTGVEPLTGAAGGLGYGVAAFLGGRLQPGATAVLELLGFEKLLKDADLVLTGEGSFDSQTAEGKLIAAIAPLCRKHDVPLVVLAATVEPGIKIEGVTAALGIARYGARRQDSLNETTASLKRHAAVVIRLMLARRR